MLPEKTFENKVKAWLISVGVYPLGYDYETGAVPAIGYFEKRWGGGYSKSGLPDLHVVVNGINLDVELKAATGKPSELQKYMIRQINAAGSLGLILYPAGFPAFQEIVKGVIACNSVTAVLKPLKAALSNTRCDTLTR